jgi:hypothetical protein
MMNGKSDHMIVCPPPQNHCSTERGLQEVKGRAKDLLRDLLDCLRFFLAVQQLAKLKVSLPTFSHHLQRLLLAWQKREPQHFLPLHNPTDRRFAVLRGDQSTDRNQATDMICRVADRNWRGLPTIRAVERTAGEGLLHHFPTSS